jgi:hypothetical protein
MCLRISRSTVAAARPIAIPPPAAINKFSATLPPRAFPVMAAIAVFRATSAVASLTRLSPSKIDTMRRGMPTRRAVVVAATASVGATTAPRAKAAASDTAGTAHHTATPTTSVVNATRPTDSSTIAWRLARKSTSDVRIAAA